MKLFARDPLSSPRPLIRRVYSYAAYRLGDGPDAEDVTSETFERALRYRHTYDPRKGEPEAWLLAIARNCVADLLAARASTTGEVVDVPAPGNLEEDAARRIDAAGAVLSLEERDRELIALRYGADLTARQIAELLGERTNTIEVALHRALQRLRRLLGDPQPSSGQASTLGTVELS